MKSLSWSCVLEEVCSPCLKILLMHMALQRMTLNKWSKMLVSIIWLFFNTCYQGFIDKAVYCLSLSLSLIMLCHANTCTMKIKLQGHEITKDIKKCMTGE